MGYNNTVLVVVLLLYMEKDFIQVTLIERCSNLLLTLMYHHL